MRRVGIALLAAAAALCRAQTFTDADLDLARDNAAKAAWAFERADHYMHGWLAHADPKSGLIPQNLSRGKDLWNAQDAAADNYVFLVLTAWMTDCAMFEGRMKEMLATERRLTSRVGTLPDDFLFSTQGFRTPQPDHNHISFGASEYIKDGLMPITEWLGTDTPWFARLREMMDDLWAMEARMTSDQGRPIPQAADDSFANANVEMHGECLQILPRLFWITGDRRYLDYAIRLGDHYLLGKHHPTEGLAGLRLTDHGNEILSGLAELYATVSATDPAKAAEYRPSVYRMLDRVLELGRNEDGLIYVAIDPKNGKVTHNGLCDTFGYVYNAFYTVYLTDRDAREAYREAVRKMLASLRPKYTGFRWADGSADGYADAIEGVLNLYNRERVAGVPAWLDSEIRTMWAGQQPDGVIEGWHGDGNVARTSIMYALWKTQGVTVTSWRPDVRFGSVARGDRLLVVLSADGGWSGRLRFDKPRRRLNLHLPFDWTRINQFPEWFTVEPGRTYVVSRDGREERVSGRRLIEGLPCRLSAGEEARIVISPAPAKTDVRVGAFPLGG